MRWNFTFHIKNSILESEDAFISSLVVMNASVPPLSREEWEELQEKQTEHDQK